MSGGKRGALAHESRAGIGSYIDDVRSVLRDRWAHGDVIDWALSQERVLQLLRQDHRHGSHAGYSASRIHRYIATRHDLATARTHEEN